MLTSKVTSKGQVTLPKKLPDQLDVRPGDTLVDAKWHAALAEILDEWNSPEDDEAFRDL